jgi:hypothetical protein
MNRNQEIEAVNLSHALHDGNVQAEGAMLTNIALYDGRAALSIIQEANRLAGLGARDHAEVIDRFGHVEIVGNHPPIAEPQIKMPLNFRFIVRVR